MANDPKFVRLRTGLNGRYDLRSGWGISGLDVKEMPDKEERPKAYSYVRGEINAGRLEGASKAEYDETHVDLLADTDEDAPYQERTVREKAMIGHRKIKARRAGSEESNAAEADEKRRKAILKDQGKVGKGKAVAEDDDDDDDSSDEYDVMGKAALVKEAKDRELDSTGTADDLRARLRAADEDSDDTESDDDDEDESEDDSEDDESEVDSEGDGSES